MASAEQSIRQPSPVAEAAEQYAFRLEGDYWTVVYDGAVCRVRDAKGMRYLALLLAHPGECLSVASLLASVAPPTATVSTNPDRARPAVTKRIRDAIAHLAAHNAALGYHLATAIKTGNHCVYLPDPQRQIQWGASMTPSKKEAA